MRRGEIWWARFPAPSGVRPALLVSRDVVYASRTSLTVAPVTRTWRPLRSYVAVGVEDGLPQEWMVSLDDMQTIPKASLGRRITTLSQGKMREVDEAIRYALGLPQFVAR